MSLWRHRDFQLLWAGQTVSKIGTEVSVLAIPLIDLVCVVILRWRIGQPFYVGDTNHLSHRLVRLGLSRTRAVVLIWLAAIVIGALVYFC